MSDQPNDTRPCVVCELPEVYVAHLPTNECNNFGLVSHEHHCYVPTIDPRDVCADGSIQPRKERAMEICEVCAGSGVKIKAIKAVSLVHNYRKKLRILDAKIVGLQNAAEDMRRLIAQCEGAGDGKN